MAALLCTLETNFIVSQTFWKKRSLDPCSVILNHVVLAAEKFSNSSNYMKAPQELYL